MKYLCSVGQVIEAENPDEAKSRFLDLHLVCKLEDVDCIEFDIPDVEDINVMADEIEDCLARHHD